MSDKATGSELTHPDSVRLERARRTYLANLLINENYFGGVEGSDLPAVYPVQGNTLWEQLTCVGYNPRAARLDAIVHIKRPTGYEGDLCTPGSQEYVRFFVDWGAGFQDVGLTSFTAHDIPATSPHPDHPLSYMVSLSFSAQDHARFCRSAVLPVVRAVLSWNYLPSLDPNALPPFGNRLDARIQLQPREITLGGLIEEGLLAKEQVLLQGVNPNAALAKAEPVPVPWQGLIEGYRKAEVPDHRLFYPTLAPLLSGQRGHAAVQHLSAAALEKAGVDLASLIDQLKEEPEGGNTTFEELVCAGLSTDTDTCGAVIHVKRPDGYSGTLCQGGSREYVAFWADWDNNGSFDEYLGTATVDVHDIATIPGGGLYYAVFLPVNLLKRLRPCDRPMVIGLRAVMSWAVPPSTTDPNALQYWGNRLGVRVQLRPSGAGQGPIDLLYRVGSVAIADISPATFLAYPSGGVLSSACSAPAMDRPFGGAVLIQGRIYNSGAPGMVHFQVQYAPHGSGSWLPVSHDETFAMEYPLDLVNPTHYVSLIEPDGWFPYQEDPTVSPPIFERDAHLAWWSTGALEGDYDLRLAYTTDYPLTSGSVIHYSSVVSITLDNTNYQPSLTANAVVDPASTLDLVIDGGDCHSYAQGETINGHLRALDQHFWNWSLELQPTTHTNGVQPSPQCRSYTSLGDGGDANAAWSLDTTIMDRCGYTLMLHAADRAIVDSNTSAVHSNAKAVGFSVH